MGLFDKLFSKPIDEPIFIKEFDSESNKQLQILNELLDKVGDDQKYLIENEIKILQVGLHGEKNVAYELKNSFLPIICLHDIRLEHRDYSAQFDFIVISKKCVFVLETKKLTGDIIVDQGGNFIRVFKDYQGNVYKKEGINSPISQNEKHVNILNRFLEENKIGRNIPIYPLVVIANPKTIITYKYTKKEVRDVIIKHDQIRTKILDVWKTLDNSSITINNKEMLRIAEFLVENDSPIEYDYVKRFKLKIEEKPAEEEMTTQDVIVEEDQSVENIDEDANPRIKLDDTLFESLREYRLQKAKEKNIPPYWIFTNEQLANLILNKPRNKAEYTSLPGFGEKKFEDYGQDIIAIIWGSDNKSEEIDNFEKTDNDNQLYDKLREFRLNQSKQENLKPYMIFNNEELESLCTIKPKTKDEFIAIKGFGEKKYDKYGIDIIEIIKKYG